VKKPETSIKVRFSGLETSPAAGEIFKREFLFIGCGRLLRRTFPELPLLILSKKSRKLQYK